MPQTQQSASATNTNFAIFGLYANTMASKPQQPPKPQHLQKPQQPLHLSQIHCLITTHTTIRQVSHHQKQDAIFEQQDWNLSFSVTVTIAK